jgi:hypothetical protein
MNRGARAIASGILLAALAACSADSRRAGETGAASRGYEAQQLVGVTDNTLLQAFGPPAQRRSEPPAEVWQYRSTGCVVDFYLYHQREGGSQRPLGLSVVHLEARSPASRRLPVDSCLTGL